METNQPRSTMRKARVVLRAHGGKRQQLLVSDGSETHDSVSEADTVAIEAESVHYNHSAWEDAPTISSDNESQKLIVLSPTELESHEKFEISTENGRILHSTPLKHNSSVKIDSGPIHSPPQSVLPAAVFKISSSNSESNFESPEEDESDNVFVENSPQHYHQEQVHPKLQAVYSGNHHGGSSGSLTTSLPPLPNSGVVSKAGSNKRRPQTSPGQHGSSTDSYLSPLHTSASPSEKRSHRARSNRSRRVSGRNRVHPEVKPKLAEFSYTSPVHRLKHSTSSASQPNLGRFNSSSSSINSTLSVNVPPLLTSDLRRGGQKPSSMDGGSWDFDAEAQLENCFPDKHIQVFVATWNMQEQKDLPSCIDDLLLPLSHETASDMYVIGTQESTPSRREWEILIQRTLGPSYVLAQSTSLGVIYLLFYLRRDLIWFCSAVRSASYATRPGTLIKTKGGLGLSFTLFGSSFLFVTSHFTAHDHKVSERNSDMQRIAANLTLSDSSDKVDEFDHVFWFGDLNYRVELDREQADHHLASSDWMPLLLQDQLTREILQGNVFGGFSEQPITFPPSYKFDLQSDLYDSSEKRRTPSWTDRILYKSQHRFGITGCGYDSCHSLKTSDHRPVYGIFRVQLEPSRHIEGIPEQVVTFDRDIYLRAQKHRRMVAKQMSQRTDEPDGAGPSSDQSSKQSSRHVTSTVCAIL